MKRLTIDNKVCTGCRSCETICSLVHSAGLIDAAGARIRVREDSFSGAAQAVACRQCPKPRCVEACPHFAMHQEPGLHVPVIDRAKCAGVSCLACVQACPYGAMFFDHRQDLPFTCDLCGGQPACISVCRAYPHLPHAALSYA